MKERLFAVPAYTTAEEIRALRKRLKLTQREFAELICCAKSTVERWDAGSLYGLSKTASDSEKGVSSQTLVYVPAEALYTDRCQ